MPNWESRSRCTSITFQRRAGAEDVLYEFLLKSGFPLTTKVKSTKMAGKQVFSIGDGASAHLP